jgi:hypothetical protein
MILGLMIYDCRLLIVVAKRKSRLDQIYGGDDWGLDTGCESERSVDPAESGIVGYLHLLSCI